MPFYVYLCGGCESEFETFHSIKETLSVCNLCSCQDRLQRIPQLTNPPLKKAEKRKKVGALADEFIEDARHDLHMQKQETAGQEYKP
jgi:hypothetical protein